MAGTDWQTRHPVATELLKNGKDFSFYEAVRLLHGLHKDAPRIGHQGPPELERVRLRPHLSLSFPGADVAQVATVESPEGLERYRLDVTFMGLYGTSSPLPSFYTEDLIRLENDESLLRGFLDLFHHRILSLLFRTWEKYRHTVQYDAAGNDWFSSRLLTWLGAGLETHPRGEALRPGRLLAYAGLLTQQPRSAAALQAMLADHFTEAGVEIEQCKGHWSEIDPRQHNRLGGRNCTLGADLTLGAAVFDRAGNFGVDLGPLGFDSYMKFLPDGDNIAQLRELVDLFNNDCLDYEVTVTLRGTEVKRAKLDSGIGNRESGIGKAALPNTDSRFPIAEPYTRLGWSSWLGDASPKDESVTFKFKGWKHGRG